MSINTVRRVSLNKNKADEKNEILFGGYGPSPPKIPEFKPGEGPPTDSTILQAAFSKFTSTDEQKKLYGDPQKGATLEQAWRTQGIFSGKWPVCLLAAGRPLVATNEINPLVKMNPKQLVDTLSDILTMYHPSAAVIMYYDGNIGHAITLLRYDVDTSRFIYHDPWPGVSLLNKEYNAAGIDAKRVDGQIWSITAIELEKVVFASFVFQNLWGEYMGYKYFITYDEFKNSDFWSFFNLTQTDTQLNNSEIVISLQNGGLRSEIDLKITLNQKQRISKGELKIKRSWLTSSPFIVNPFALDIVRSFIAALTPPPDQQLVQGIIQELNESKNSNYLDDIVAKGQAEIALHEELFTFLGFAPSFNTPLQFSNISMANCNFNDVDWFQIIVTVDTL